MAKKLKKEDITKYGTLEEIKLLEGSDPFEIPVGEEQDQSLPEEEISLEDEQEAGVKSSEDYESKYGPRTIIVPEALMERLYVYIIDDEREPDEREELMMELEHLLKDGSIDEENEEADGFEYNGNAY
jgi:hypothetical protein